MSFKISDHFKQHSEKDWLTSALKSLKLDSESELDKYLTIDTIENFVYRLNPSRDIAPLHLNTFPDSTKFIRDIKTGQSNLESTSDGVDFLLTRRPTVVHKDQKLFQVLEASERVHFGDLVLIDVLEILEEFSFDEAKLRKFLKAQLALKNTHLMIDSAKLHDAGLNMTAEMSFSLHVAFSFLELAHERKKKVFFIVASDSMFFSNIAKFRSLRYLFETIMENTGHISKNAFQIIGKPSLRETTLYNPWANALRSTVSTTAHILSGADYSISYSYNVLEQIATLDEVSNLGLRQSRNIFNILNEESCLGYVADPAKGSYLIEDISRQLTQKSFEELKSYSLERNWKVLFEKMAKKAEHDAQKRQEAVANRKKIVCGINNFIDTNEQVHKRIKEDAFKITRKSLFPLRRESKRLEHLRFCTTHDSKFKNKSILIVTMGNLKDISSRVSFCEKYFEVIGLKTDVVDLENVTLKNLKDSCALVYCAKDSDYKEFLRVFSPPKGKKPFLAGKEFKHQDVINIFHGQNILSILTLINEGVAL